MTKVIKLLDRFIKDYGDSQQVVHHLEQDMLRTRDLMEAYTQLKDESRALTTHSH